MSDPVSVDSTSSNSIGEEYELSMTDIYYLLLSDLSEVSDLLEKAKRHTVENQPAESWGSFIRVQKRAQNNSSNLQSLFKKRILEAISKNIDDFKPIGEPLHTGNLNLELRGKLLQRVYKDRESIQEMTTELTQLRNFNKELERQAEELQRIMAVRAETGEMVTTLKWQEVDKKVKHQRLKLVKNVRLVTQKLCPNSDIEDILAAALKEAMGDKDPYIQVEDSSSEDVEFLLRCNLIKRHPNDLKLIRLVLPQ